MTKEQTENKKYLEEKIKGLDKELSAAKKKLIPLQAEEIESWFEKVKGKAFYYKWDKHDSEYSGIFKVESIDEKETYGIDWMYLRGTVITLFGEKGSIDSITLNYRMRKDNFNLEDKVSSAKFKSLVEKFTKKLNEKL